MSGQVGPIPAPTDPALKPPPGVRPCFESAYSLNPYQILEIAACASITSIMLAARVYIKLALLKRFTWEDYSAVLAWVSFVVYMGLLDAVGRNGGGGIHQWNLIYKVAQYNYKFSNYGDMIYSISLLTTKLSLMLLIKRIFCSAQRDIPYYLTIALMVVNTVFYTCYLIVPVIVCKPRAKIWTPQLPGSCLNINNLYITSAMFNVLSDIAMLSVPIYLVCRLQMSIRRKIGISAIFCTGGLACIASVLRLIYVVFLTRTQDYTYTHFAAAMWSAAEIAFGLLCSNLVVLPRLYRHFCDVVPYTRNVHALNRKTESDRARQTRNGKSKREWVELEERAEKDRRRFAKEGRLGDEEALDEAIDGDGIERGG